MVAGLAFLSKKSFNPANLSNQKSVWEAEQESNKEKQRLREREKQLRIERDHEELARARGGDKGGEMATLRFMYDAPPGLDSKKAGGGGGAVGGDDDGNNGGIGFKRHDGDDDAAAAFRRLLAGNNNNDDDATKNNNGGMATLSSTSDSITASSSLILSGSTTEATQADRSNLTQLEKAVGKRNGGGSSLTYEEQVARFPQLKNAPMALKKKGDGGEEIMDAGVTFKPLGAQIRNVRCLKCGIWGHSRGDRECKLSGWDPFASSSTGIGAGATCSIMPPPAKRQIDEDDDGGDRKVRARQSDDSDGGSESEESVDIGTNGRRANTDAITVRNRKGTAEKGNTNTDGGRGEVSTMIDHTRMILTVLLLFHHVRKEDTDEGRMIEKVGRKGVGGLDLGLGLAILLGLHSVLHGVNI
eukprot:CAMPEP_0203674330 /NCGR_PEP_ID=MMETSP0090-20130426/15783_1 /ASSEMBLY_ACC=CAM_ASM_001088 /TAXON_ID=426623 /ORGANISM="Chaetoceros affinis, Strain CCMP159" /LENGTH=413 /DNA_ID=CAMNT_0050540183 /DNA_START=103 /DNA_END=1345 /DNA_ORIENTATION=+